MSLDFCKKCRRPYAKLRRGTFQSTCIRSCLFIHGNIRWVISWFKNEETLESAALVAVFIGGAFYAGVESARLAQRRLLFLLSCLAQSGHSFTHPSLFNDYTFWFKYCVFI